MRFLISNKLELKLEKILGFRNIQEKIENKEALNDQRISENEAFTA